MQGSAALPFGDVEPGGTHRRHVRNYSFPHRFSPFPGFRASLGQDVDDNAWPPRSARSAATISRISDDAARLDLECPTDAFAHGKLVRHRISWAAERSLCPGSR